MSGSFAYAELIGTLLGAVSYREEELGAIVKRYVLCSFDFKADRLTDISLLASG